MTTKPTKEIEVHRLTRAVYDALERDCVPPHVGPSTTDVQAGFALGVQAVLKKLRDGIVVP